MKNLLSSGFLLVAALAWPAACTTPRKPEAARNESKAIDPVCGAPVDRSTPYFRRAEGQVYYFDSDECVRIFERWRYDLDEETIWDGLLKIQDR